MRGVGAIVVFDLSDPSTLDAAKQWIKELKEYSDSDVFMVIAGNKCDLPQTASTKAEVDQ